MLESFKRSFILIKESASVLRQDPELIWLTIASFVSLGAIGKIGRSDHHAARLRPPRVVRHGCVIEQFDTYRAQGQAMLHKLQHYCGLAPHENPWLEPSFISRMFGWKEAPSCERW